MSDNVCKIAMKYEGYQMMKTSFSYFKSGFIFMFVGLWKFLKSFKVWFKKDNRKIRNPMSCDVGVWTSNPRVYRAEFIDKFGIDIEYHFPCLSQNQSIIEEAVKPYSPNLKCNENTIYDPQVNEIVMEK